MRISSPRQAVVTLGATVALGVLLALAGCSASPSGSVFSSGDLSGSGSGSGASSKATTKPDAAQVDLSKIDPCTLLTLPEAEKLVGTTLSPGQDTKDPSNPDCTYNPDPNGATAQVIVHLGDGAKKFYDTDVRLTHTFEDVPGIGTEAHVEDFAIFFQVKGTWGEVAIVRLDAAAAYKQPLIDAATTVAGRV